MEQVIIIGAGPSGLATAACLKHQNIPFTLVDRTGRAGGSFPQMDGNLKLLSPRRYVNLPYFAYPGTEDYPSVADYANYLAAYARCFELLPQAAEVNEVRRRLDGFEIQCGSAANLHCQFLIVATGLFGFPVWPEIHGLTTSRGNSDSPVMLHARDWLGTNAFRGQRMLVIGVGISGVSIAEECARAGLPVIVSHRSNRVRLVPPRLLGRDILDWFHPFELLPRRLFGSLCQRGVHAPGYDNGYRALVKEGKISEVPEIHNVKGRSVRFADGSHHEIDVIVAATGYRYDTPFLPTEVRRLSGGHPMAEACESPDWPGLFFIGAPCSRRINSEFLRGIASDSVWVARRIRQRLDLPRE